ncbi:dsRBD fold-containing protein, partial [Kitasatospora sp. NPDC096204]|uniref:dsRBD fold-containing protein n=1 Tax=Kitasatospora sp. NPDC096204 TaxID=3364094 RepID=UPI003803F5FA
MTTKTPTPMRTKRWTLRLDLFEEGDATKVHAVLDTGDNTLEARTTAHRSPHDPPVCQRLCSPPRWRPSDIPAGGRHDRPACGQ